MTHSKLVILGSGPAGYTAAIYAARAGLSPLILHGNQPGGQLTVTTDVDNFPGFASTIQGPWLMEQMEAQALACGAQLEMDTIVRVDLSARPFTLEGELGDLYSADSLIICTGAQAKWLGVAGEEAFRGAGVSACATCDGPFFKDKTVAVVGGGNTAVEEALYLSRIASHVTLIHRRDQLRAEKLLQDKLFAASNIDIVWDSVVSEVLGSDNGGGMSALAIENIKSGEMHERAFDGLFVAIGHSPKTSLFAGQLDMDDEGYISTRSGTAKTSLPGVFAAGDVQDKIYRQAVTAAGTGCMAALDAEKYLAETDS